MWWQGIMLHCSSLLPVYSLRPERWSKPIQSQANHIERHGNTHIDRKQSGRIFHELEFIDCEQRLATDISMRQGIKSRAPTHSNKVSWEKEWTYVRKIFHIRAILLCFLGDSGLIDLFAAISLGDQTVKLWSVNDGDSDLSNYGEKERQTTPNWVWIRSR